MKSHIFQPREDVLPSTTGDTRANDKHSKIVGFDSDLGSLMRAIGGRHITSYNMTGPYRISPYHAKRCRGTNLLHLEDSDLLGLHQ